MWNKIKSIIKNKYIITTLLFVIWVLFFDADNIFSHYEHRKELKELEARKVFLAQETNKEKILDKQLTNNPAIIEKMARELYYMKRSNEIVYVEE